MLDDPNTEAMVTEAAIRVPDHVVFRAFPSEMVMLNLNTGNYHGLNGSASRMLELLQETGSARKTAEAVAREYGEPVDEVMRDLTKLCVALVDRGLLELTAPPSG